MGEYAARHAIVGFFTGVTTAAITGADGQTAFRRGYQGAALAGGLAVVDKAALGMRKFRADQCKAIGCAGTDSVGYRGDNIKLAGSGPSIDKHGVYYPSSPLGDAQVRPGRFLGIPYPKGGVLDRVHEAFAGPHDFLNYTVGLYTDAGYWAGNVTHGYALFWESVNLGLAAPIVAGSALAPISPAVVGAGVIDDYD